MKILPLILLFGSSLPLCGFAKDLDVKPLHSNNIGSGSQVLRVLNMEDYIYTQETEEDEADLVVQFEEYAKSLGYENCHVVYDTTDTNETLYSEMLTGKSTYDVICPSDYMIQKLISEDLLYKLTDEDKDMIPNYFGQDSKASQKIKNALGNIICENGEELDDYAVGYMWGTLGVIFDPIYKEFVARNISEEQIIEDMSSWDVLWDERYKNTLSIKDSMRDTYFVGLTKTYQEELTKIYNDYIDETIELDEYQRQLSDIVNRCSETEVQEVIKYLDKLKANSFGLEVDSGKLDIVTGKIGINLAWSGDAAFSISDAWDQQEKVLYYALPLTTSNLWFDAWVIPKLDKSHRSEAQQELALLFLDFICDPYNAAQNMDFTGYTSFIGGDEVFDLVDEYYGVEEGEIPVDLTYFFDGTVSEEYYDEDGRIIIYTDEYYVDDDINETNCVGGAFFCQYPDEETMNRCGIMRDFGKNNKYLIAMWEDFKSDPLPTWALILIIVEVALIFGIGGYYIVSKKARYSLRQKRKKNNLNN